MGCYSSCFWHSLGHAKHCGGFVILLASMAWLGNHTSYIWNLVLGCLMWIVWLEQNRRSFKDTEKKSQKSFASVVSLIGLGVGALLIVHLSPSFYVPL